MTNYLISVAPPRERSEICDPYGNCKGRQRAGGGKSQHNRFAFDQIRPQVTQILKLGRHIEPPEYIKEYL